MNCVLRDDPAWLEGKRFAFDLHNAIHQLQRSIRQTDAGWEGVDKGIAGTQHLSDPAGREPATLLVIQAPRYLAL